MFRIHVVVPPGTIASLYIPVRPSKLANVHSNNNATFITADEDDGEGLRKKEITAVERDGRAGSHVRLISGRYDLHGPLECVTATG